MTDNKVPPVLVIGAGLGRTGTNSLKLALECLLGKPCYHLKDVHIRRKSDVPKWIAIEDRLNNGDGQFDETLCRDILQGYGAAVDHPVCVYYKELMELYPDSKVILTVRDPEIWLAGSRSTILPRDLFANRPWTFYLFRYLMGLGPLHEMYLNSWRRVFGQNIDFSSDTAMLNGFIAWTEKVKQTVPSDRLLVYEINKGWEPLCRFLNCSIPDKPFPHVNEYKEMRRLMRLERRSAKVLRWVLPALLILLVASLLYRFCFKFMN